MWYHIKSIEERIKHRATLQACPRCGFYFPKKQQTCHHCAGMSDQEVVSYLARKKRFRMGLGKYMFIAAAVIVLLMYLV